MEGAIKYLSDDDVITFNLLALELIKAKKKDKHELLSWQKLEAALEACRLAQGGLYEKAAVLMSELAFSHVFASGNRRTAFIATKEFVKRNKGRFSIPDAPGNAEIMVGIREGRYSINEIAEWIKHGEIIERKR